MMGVCAAAAPNAPALRVDVFESANEDHPEVDAWRDRGTSVLAVERLAGSFSVGVELGFGEEPV